MMIRGISVLCCALLLPVAASGANAGQTLPHTLSWEGEGHIVLVQNANQDAKRKKKQRQEQRKRAQEKKKRQQRNENAARRERQERRQRVDEQQRRQQRNKNEARRERVNRQIDRRRAATWRGRRQNIIVRERRFVTRRGGTRIIRSRRIVVVNPRYRNRYVRGRSIYYLPPRGARIAASAFVLSAAVVGAAAIHEALAAPPVVRPSRFYTVDEIIEDPEVRQMVRSVDVDTIEFASGSSEISNREMGKLQDIATAIQQVLSEQPDQIFLIEGHTDAVGGDEDNLALSEDRAASVMAVLVDEFGINEQSLQAVGYGEQYLKVETDGPARENRRVTIRNISGLIDRQKESELEASDRQRQLDEGAEIDEGQQQ